VWYYRSIVTPSVVIKIIVVWVVSIIPSSM